MTGEPRGSRLEKCTLGLVWTCLQEGFERIGRVSRLIPHLPVFPPAGVSDFSPPIPSGYTHRGSFPRVDAAETCGLFPLVNSLHEYSATGGHRGLVDDSLPTRKTRDGIWMGGYHVELHPFYHLPYLNTSDPGKSKWVMIPLSPLVIPSYLANQRF